MAENIKEIKTRVALRTGDYAYWTTGAGKDIALYKGEVCICTVAKADNQATNAPTVLFKVADENGKKFGQLDWVSGLAADVYAWAKKDTPDWTDFPALPLEVVDNGTGKFVTDFTYANNKLTITRADVALNDISDKEKIALSADLGNVTTLTTTAKTAVGAINEHDAEIGNLASLNTENKGNLVAAINEALQAVEVGGTGSVVTVTKETTPTEGSEATYTVKQGGNAVDVKIEIPKYDTEADYGVLDLTAGTGIEITGSDAQHPTIGVKANTYDAYGAAEAARQYAENNERYLNSVYFKETWLQFSDNNGTTLATVDINTLKDKIDTNTEYHVEYDSTNKKIKLVAGADASKMEIDATAFIKDGMIESVELVQEDASGNKGQFLKLTWNDDGKDVTYVPVGELVDVYTGSTGAEVNVAISNTNVVSASLNSDVATKIANGATAYGWGDHAKAGYAKTADLGDLAAKDKIVEGDIDGTIAASKITNFATEVAAIKVANATNADKAADADKLGGQLPSHYATAQSVTDITKDNGTIDSKIAAYNTGKNFGDIITHNVAEFATSAQGAKADTALQEITTTANNGLKVTNKNNIDIDTDIVFVLNCNY